MTCPRCGKGMNEILSQGVLIDFCSACKGAWLDKGECRYFAAEPDKVDKALSGEFIDAHPSKMTCPRCKGAMTEGGVFDANYQLDRCNECGGVWFDARELGRLRDAKMVGLDATAGRAGRPAGSMATPTGPGTSGGSGIEIGEAAPADHRLDPSLILASVPAVPNLFLRGASVFVGLTFIVGAIFIGATAAAGLHPLYAVLFTLGFILLQYLIGPFILDFSLRWMNGMHWVSRNELPPHIVQFLDAACKRHNVKFPRMGIIEDGAPNAFTYGHVPNNARIVITRGILNLLDEKEADAVVAHELGHVVHWDAVVMTLAGCVPILCYGIYRVMIRIGSSGKKNTQGAYLIALVAYVLYILAQYLVLLLSRTREYYADRFSAAETRNPNALASALVKIAYGLVESQAAVARGGAGAAAASGGGGSTAARAFGIFDPGAARNLAAASYAGGSFSRENLVGAMQWDLWNPWARWFEIHSTHPLPARRLQALAGEAVKLGQVPLIVFDRKQPESYWDEFLVDLFIKTLPLILMGVIGGASAAILGPPALLGGIVLGYGLGALGRVLFTYHLDGTAEGGYPDSSVAALLKVVKVSPVRGVPARLKGKVIGRGNPGYILSEDVVLQDRTGILFLDYHAPLALFNWWFALARVPEIMGRDVEAIGWYRRGPAPYFEIRELRYGGKTRKSYVKSAKMVWAILAIGAGLFLTFGGFMAGM